MVFECVTIRQHVRAREHSWKGEGLFPRCLSSDGHCMETVYSLFTVCKREETQLGFSKHIKKHVRIRLERPGEVIHDYKSNWL